MLGRGGNRESSALLPSPSLAVELRDLRTPSPRPPIGLGQKEDALCSWTTYKNSDRLLDLIYQYYVGGGRQNIILDQLVQLGIVIFVVCFGLFLVYGVDWSAFLWKSATASNHPRLWEVAHWPLLPLFVHVAFLFFLVGWLGWLMRTLAFAEELRIIELIYENLLGLDAAALCNNVDFDVVIQRLEQLNDSHPIITGRLDAHGVCNRLMRRENYMIALFNKNLLDLGVPLSPSHQIMTRSLELNLQFALLGFVFDDRGNIKKRFTKLTEKATLSAELKQRFRLLALLNVLLSPFILIYLAFYFFLRYAEELYRNPAMFGAKTYSRLAHWRFREFNELPHYFADRLEQSHRKANMLLDQFHTRPLVTVCRFLGFVSGSLIAVLLFVSLANEDLLMHFELSQGKSPIWYLPIFGLLLALCKAMLPDSNRRRDPRRLISQLIEHTHYNPPAWKSMSSAQIAKDFGSLYRYRLVSICEDFYGILAIPYLLWFKLPAQGEALIDFFREFSVHVDNLGYVCSFALFNFSNPTAEDEIPELDKRSVLQPGKMAKSYLVFRGHHPSTKDLNLGGDELLEEFSEYATNTMRKSSIVLDKLKKRENISISDAEENEEENRLTINNGYPGSRVIGLMSLFDKFYQQSNRFGY
jgi:autophagy-related protein 9